MVTLFLREQHLATVDSDTLQSDAVKQASYYSRLTMYSGPAILGCLTPLSSLPGLKLPHHHTLPVQTVRYVAGFVRWIWRLEG